MSLRKLDSEVNTRVDRESIRQEHNSVLDAEMYLLASTLDYLDVLMSEIDEFHYDMKIVDKVTYKRNKTAMQIFHAYCEDRAKKMHKEYY